jgi:hypothetical protein
MKFFDPLELDQETEPNLASYNTPSFHAVKGIVVRKSKNVSLSCKILHNC